MKKIKIKISGRPGWHIECSAMSQKFLKTNTLDIHAGGRDLIFPHHENEIAQAEALTGRPFAKYWLHHGLLTINGQKMSKTLGNFITIKDFLKDHTSFVLKLFFISAHYHSPLDYNDAAVHIAKEHEKTFGIFFRRAKKYEEKNNTYKRELVDYKKRFIKAMDDDFNTPVALSILFEMVSAGHKCFDKNDIETGVSISKMLEEMLRVFNLEDIKSIYQGMITSEEIVRNLVGLQNRYSNEFQKHSILLVALHNMGDNLTNLEDLIESFIKLRNSARQKKNFKLADDIRKDLHDIKIVLEDTKEDTKWRIII